MIEQIVALCERFPPLPLGPREVPSEARSAWRIGRYRTLGIQPRQTFLLAPDGFIGLVTGQIDAITQEPQARIFDRAGACEALLPEAIEAARQSRADWLITLVEVDDTAWEESLQRAGFAVESYRIAKRFRTPHETEQALQVRGVYRVRPAEANDLLPVALLSTVSSQQAIPAGRSVNELEVKGRFMDAHLATVLDETLCFLVAETVSDDELVGYMKIRLCQDETTSDEIVGYIEDFSVAQAHWGMASHSLFFGIEQALHAKGVEVLVGDISAANGRSLAGATRKVGLQVEFQRWGKKLFTCQD
ncbi:MAG TPA: GNAT family N-acetyltransferase [Candidatus Xenobia bacterium]